MRLVGHGRHVGAAGGAGAHHHGDLGYAERGHAGLVEEDAAEMIAVGEHLVLVRQDWRRRNRRDRCRAGGSRARCPGAQVLLHGERVVGAALHGGVVDDDDAFPAADAADARDDAGRRHRLVIDAVGRQLRQLQERRARIEKVRMALARQQLAARRGGARAPPCRRRGGPRRRARAGQRPAPERIAIAPEFLRTRVECGAVDRHRRISGST